MRLELTNPDLQKFVADKVSAGGYQSPEAVVEAASHEAAVEIFQSHPHLALVPGNSIDVIECPAPPT
jgi:hypothetical protein